MARDNDDVIDEAVVRIGADTSGLRRDVEKGAKKELAGLKFEIPVELDEKGLKQQGTNQVANLRAKYIKEQLNRVRNGNEQVQRAQDQARQHELKQARSFQESMDRLHLQAAEAELRRVRSSSEQISRAQEQASRESVDRERRASDARVKTLEAENKRRRDMFKTVTDTPQLIDYGGKGIKPMNALYGVVVAMTPALFAMGTSAIQASTSIAALGAAGVGAALGISAVAVAFQGIGDLLSLRKTVQNEATTKAANSARDAVGAADDLAQSKRALADAQRDEATAAQGVHKARQEAIRDLEDLRQAVIDLDNQYRNDQLSVAEAKQNVLATDRNFFATALDRARARQDLRDAQTRLSDTGLERKQKKEDLKESVSKGVEGSDKVRDAKERARDARDRTLDAQAALRKGATGVAGGIDKTSSAAAQLEEKLKALSPAARDMYDWFVKNEDQLKKLQREISQKTLPGFNDFLDAINTVPKGGKKTTLQLAAEYAGDLGAIIGKYVGKFGEFTKSPLFRDSMARIQKINTDAFDKLGDALIKLADPITRILDKAAPGFGSFADMVLKLSDSFATFIEKADKNGSLAQWFEDSRTEAKKWWDIAKNVLTILKNLFTAALPTGGSLVDSFQKFTQSIADWSGSESGQKDIKDFFQKFKELPYAKIADFFKNATIFFVAFRAFKFAKSLNPLVAAFAGLAATNPGLVADLFEKTAKALTGVMGFMVEHPEAATALLGILAAAKVGKAVGFSLKLPAMDALRKALTSKFKFLDQFIGGGATTATMTVYAKVVNVIGGAGGLPGGKNPPIVGGAPSTVSKLAVGALSVAGGVYAATFAVDTILGKDGSALEGLGSIAMGPEAYEEWSKENAPAFRRFFTMTLPGWISGGGTRGWSSFKDAFYNTFGDDAAHFFSVTLPNSINAGTQGSGGWAGLATNLGHWFSTTLPNVMSGKTNGWAGVGDYLLEQLSMYGGDGILGGIIDGLTGGKYTEFKEKISGWVDGVVNWFKECFGIASPATTFIPIGADLVNGIWAGFTATWDALTETVFTWIDTHFTTPLVNIFSTAGGLVAGGFAQGFASLTQKLAGPAAKVLSWIDTNFINKINALLTSLGATGIPTLTGTSTKDAGKNVGKIIGDVGKKLNKGTEGAPHADGGIIPGHSPHPRADNIPAMLTANEYVQPVAAVQHYGTDFMDAIRTRQYPRYAKGGLVGELTGKLGDNLLTRIAGAAIKKTGGSVAAAAARLFGTAGGGGSDQEYTGRTPRGLGAVAGLGNRMMAAVVDIHNKFPWASVTSGYRPGAITVGGNRSYHGMRRATDWPASMELFNYFVERFGKTAREIIYSPAGGGQIWRGQPHMYTGAVRATHWNHVHLALADGGLVPKKFDTGGVLPPGYSLAFNGTGHNETVRTRQQEQNLQGPVRLDRRDIGLLAAAVNNTGTPTVNMDGRRVAELTNRYNYLPTGVS